MQKISNHISWSEAIESPTQKQLGISNIPNRVQLQNMVLLAEKVFEPLRIWANEPIKVNSFFRSDALNKAVGGSKTSQHTANDGSAIDIVATGKKTNADLFNYIKENLGFDQLIWEFGNEKQPDWVHVSLKQVGNRKQVLKAIKVAGKTKYEKFK